MKKENDNAELILGSIDNIERAAAPEFFYTRLRARMEREAETVIARPWVLRPVYALTALFLILLINAFVLIKGNNSTENITNTSDTMQSIAAEYNLNDNSIYDLNQER
ncbi:MAG TPA: hypothetical protein VFV31_13230 [Chitinophagaceae bacterium]|nr:hypothetical protein [Chitinophagaceae bacterium]